tara:strand:+ start:535 stop:1932 length:1398 start_codon:yes stop_codon:yes gene_type:complete
MKILVINVSLRPDSKTKQYPIGLSYIASAIKRGGINMDLVDLDINRFSDKDVEKKIASEDYDIVALGCLVTGYKIIKKLLKTIRCIHEKALIVVGNSVASSIPDILLNKTEADVAVMGEGEETIVELIESWEKKRSLEGVAGIIYKKNGKIIHNGKRKVIEDINSIPLPDWDIFDVNRYIESHEFILKVSNISHLGNKTDQLKVFPVSFARGCVLKCTFCYHNFIGTRYRFRSNSSLIDEIKVLNERYGVNFIVSWDDLSFHSKKQLNEFSNLILEEKVEIYWQGQVRGDMFYRNEDINLLKKMKDSGCIKLHSSLESTNPEILKAMKKPLCLDKFRRQKGLLDKTGIKSMTSLVLGYPQETPQTLAKTFRFCLDNGYYPTTGYLTPQPLTPMYELAKEKGLIKNDEEYLLKMGDRQDFLLNYTEMSDDEFQGNVLHWLKKLNKDLNVGLDENNLIKTEVHRSVK